MSFRRKKVIVAPWGNPFGWRPANYRLDGEEGTVIEVRDKNTSLSCLVKALCPDEVILVIPETLLCPSPDISRLKNYGGKPLSDVLEDGVEDGERYREALRYLEQAMKRLYEEWIGRPEPRIVITPTIGRYQCEDKSYVWEIGPKKVDPVSVYAAYTLASTVATIADLGVEPLEEVALILDTTHGINFMPLAAYRAIMAAARIISAAFNVIVEFRQYNSAPYPRNVPKPTLKIYLVRREIITPNKAAQRLVYGYLVCDAGKARPFHRAKEMDLQMNDRLNALRDELKSLIKLHEEACPIASAVHFSMPLALLQFALEHMERGREIRVLMRKLWDVLKELLIFIKINVDGPRLFSIEHLALPHYDDIKSLLAAAALMSYAVRALRTSEARFERGLVEVSLTGLREVAERWLRGPLLGVVKHELSSLREALVGKRIVRDVGPLVDRAREKMGEWVSPEGGCEDQQRIYVAHAGLARRSIEVRMEGGELYLRYRRCLERIRKCLIGALGETRKLVHEFKNVI